MGVLNPCFFVCAWCSATASFSAARLPPCRFPVFRRSRAPDASAMRSRNCSTCSPVFADSALSGLGAFSAWPVNAADQDAGVRLFSFPIPHCLNAALRSLS